MWKRKFYLVADAEPQTVIELVSSLLSKRSVKHSINNNQIVSTNIPIWFFMLRYSRRLYSRDNFVGVNPFIYIDNIKINVETELEKKTKLDITVTQIRSYMPFVFIMSMAFAIWTARVETFAGWFFVIIAVLYYLFTFHLVIGKLLPGEIKRVLKPYVQDTEGR